MNAVEEITLLVEADRADDAIAERAVAMAVERVAFSVVALTRGSCMAAGHSLLLVRRTRKPTKAAVCRARRKHYSGSRSAESSLSDFRLPGAQVKAPSPEWPLGVFEVFDASKLTRSQRAALGSPWTGLHSNIPDRQHKCHPECI